MILIVGGGGAIGSALCHELTSSQPNKVLAIDRRFQEPLAIRTLQANLEEPRSIQNLEIDAPNLEVIYLAGKVSSANTAQDIRELYLSNCYQLACFLEVLAPRITNCLLVSSISVYGTHSQEYLTEESPTAPESHYALSKLAGERVLLESATKHGFSYKIVRLAQVFGVSTAESTFPHRLRAFLNSGENFSYTGHPDTKRDYIHVRDVVRFLPLILTLGKSGIFNLGGGREYCLGEVISRVFKAKGLSWKSEGSFGKPSGQILDSRKTFEAVQARPEFDLYEWIFS